jgi:hypothetical protein
MLVQMKAISKVHEQAEAKRRDVEKRAANQR